MNIIYQLNSILWSLINILPIPLRMVAAIIILLYLIHVILSNVLPFVIRATTEIFYWAAEIISSIVVFPDYLLASKKREAGKAAIGAYSHFAGLFEALVKFLYDINQITKKVEVRNKIRIKTTKFIKYSGVFLSIFFSCVWIAYPRITDVEAKAFASKTLAAWCSFEDFNLNRKWTPISESEKHINEKMYKGIK